MGFMVEEISGLYSSLFSSKIQFLALKQNYATLQYMKVLAVLFSCFGFDRTSKHLVLWLISNVSN